MLVVVARYSCSEAGEFLVRLRRLLHLAREERGRTVSWVGNSKICDLIRSSKI